MKRLMLLRHAKAVPGEPPLADLGRPLAERGERDARRIGERLRQYAMIPGAIIASPAARTLRTAEVVADCLAMSSGDILLDAKLYLAEPVTILECAVNADPALESLLIVGHNPGLTELTHRLCPEFTVDDLPTAAVVAFDYANARHWQDIGSIEPQLCYFDYPKNTREPSKTR